MILLKLLLILILEERIKVSHVIVMLVKLIYVIIMIATILVLFVFCEEIFLIVFVVIFFGHTALLLIIKVY